MLSAAPSTRSFSVSHVALGRPPCAACSRESLAARLVLSPLEDLVASECDARVA
jgi:hypothetical protein